MWDWSSMIRFTIVCDPIGVSNNICRSFSNKHFSRSFIRDYLDTIFLRYLYNESMIMRVKVLEIFFLLQKSFHFDIYTRCSRILLKAKIKKKWQTKENDRFNFDAKWIKVSGPLWIFYDSCLEKVSLHRFECRDSGKEVASLKNIHRAVILGSWKSNWKEEGGGGGGNHLVNFGRLGANYPYFAVRANGWSVN